MQPLIQILHYLDYLCDLWINVFVGYCCWMCKNVEGWHGLWMKKSLLNIFSLQSQWIVRASSWSILEHAGLKIGDQIAEMTYGGFSEWAVVKERLAIPVPACQPEIIGLLTTGLTASIGMSSTVYQKNICINIKHRVCTVAQYQRETIIRRETDQFWSSKFGDMLCHYIAWKCADQCFIANWIFHSLPHNPFLSHQLSQNVAHWKLQGKEKSAKLSHKNLTVFMILHSAPTHELFRLCLLSSVMRPNQNNLVTSSCVQSLSSTISFSSSVSECGWLKVAR